MWNDSQDGGSVLSNAEIQWLVLVKPTTKPPWFPVLTVSPNCRFRMLFVECQVVGEFLQMSFCSSVPPKIDSEIPAGWLFWNILNVPSVILPEESQCVLDTFLKNNVKQHVRRAIRWKVIWCVGYEFCNGVPRRRQFVSGGDMLL